MKPDSPKKTAKKTARTSASGKSSSDSKSSPSGAPAPKASVSAASSAGSSGSRPATAGQSRTTKKSGATARSASSKSASILDIPPLLLEGDAPSAPLVSGPGERFALGPGPSGPAGLAESGDLPESYGTQKLFLTARDPQWLHAHWDFSMEQLRRYNARSADRHLVLRVFKNGVAGEPHREVHVHPESRSWFVHVADASTRYVAQLGYYQAERGTWVALATSGGTLTPSEALSNDLSVWFETLPIEVRFDQLLKIVRQAVREHIPLMEALQQLRTMGFPGLPDAKAAAQPAAWTPEQEKALAQVVTIDSVRRVWMGSLEITELIRRQFLQELSSQAAAARGETSSWASAIPGVSSLSSPYGGAPAPGKGFWFNVNAELIIYGATEPNAAVTIGGRTIKLRPDGTFSYRFILPDGRYALPAVATSADGTDSRSAALEFSRATDYRGDVQAHPQDPALRPPRAEHVS